MFGLDYSRDSETGQTRSGRSFDLGSEEFASGNTSAFSGQGVDRGKKFDTEQFAGGRSAELEKRFASKEFKTNDSRFASKESRFANQRSRDGKTAYRDASKAVPADPYQESSKMMRAEDYSATSGDSRKSYRAATEFPQRTNEPGDPAVNYRSEELTVDDIKGLLDKGDGKADLNN